MVHGKEEEEKEEGGRAGAGGETLGSLGHYFHGTATLQDRLGLAGSSYELAAAIPQVVGYLGRSKAERIAKFEAIAQHEEELQEVLLAYLRSKQEKGEVTIWGLSDKGKAGRVPVISFTVNGGRSSRSVVEAMEGRSRFGCRWGHFYSKRLVDDLLGLAEVDGVVRVSLVHYNTLEEVQEFVDVLDEVLKDGG